MLCSYRQSTEEYMDKVATFDAIAQSSRTKLTLAEPKLQQAISQLCLRALAESNLSTLMFEAVALVSETLGIKYCSIFELLGDRKTLQIRACFGFQDEARRRVTVGEPDSLAGYALRSRLPIIVEDWQKETRFVGKPILQEYNAIGSIATVIEGTDKPFGVLIVNTNRPRTFTQDEVDFIETIAQILAAAQARQQTEAQMVASKLAKLKDDFLNTFSEELCAPIYNIKMALEMLAKTLEQDRVFSGESSKPNAQKSKAALWFQILHNECERELKLISDLLDLQRLEVQAYPNFLYESISIPEWIPPILESLHTRVQQQQQTLKLNLSPELPRLMTEATIFKRILLELLDNACKYTPSGETITVSADVVGEKLRVTVSNSGVEIPALERDRIFHKFYRIPNNGFWKQGGLGLGLALVKQLVEQLGGTIELENCVGQTTFSMEFPANF